MKTLCITMGPEWPLAEAEFKRVGLQVEPFQAIVEDNRVLAFNKSVYECMKLAEGEDLLLFEDDVLFDDIIGFDLPSCHWLNAVEINTGTYIKMVLAYNAKPSNALTIHLGCNIVGSDLMRWQMPTNGTPKGFARLHNCWQTHANWYSKECVKYIIDNFKFVTDEYKIEGCQIFDEWLRTNVLNQGRSYVLNLNSLTYS